MKSDSGAAVTFRNSIDINCLVFVTRSLLKKGTDYSVPNRNHPAPEGASGVDRAVCPLFQ